MPLPLDERWSLLTLFEYEYGTRQALRKLRKNRQLRYITATCKVKSAYERTKFVDTMTASFICQSLGQGKEFFKHAEAADWKVKPLLLYYGMLSVVKGVLAFSFPDYFEDSKHLNHGIRPYQQDRSKCAFKADCVEVKGGSGVYQLGRKALGSPALPGGLRVSLHDMLTRLPANDSPYRALFGLLPNESRCLPFATAINDIIRFSPKTHTFSARLAVHEFEWNRFKDYLPEDFCKEFRIETPENSHGFVQLIGRTQSPQRPQIEMLCTRLLTFANNGTYVLAKVPSGNQEFQLFELELLYLFTFFLSTLARYQPHVWHNVLSGKDDLAAAVVRDLLQTAENRFLAVLQQHLRLFELIA